MCAVALPRVAFVVDDARSMASRIALSVLWASSFLTEGPLPFGAFSVGEGDKSIAFKVQGSTNPNFEGTEQKATISTISGDDMTYVRAPIPSPQGPFVPTLIWKRAK